MGGHENGLPPSFSLTQGAEFYTTQGVVGGRVSELSRSEKMLAEKTVCVLLVRGEDPDGAPIYAYVGVRADKLKEFMEAQQ